MALVSNSARELSILEAEARKSFAIAVRLREDSGRPVDISGSTFRMDVAKRNRQLGYDHMFSVNGDIRSLDRALVQFPLQAKDLDVRPDEYVFSMTMLNNGYSQVLVKGELRVLANADVVAPLEEYVLANPPQMLEVLFHQSQELHLTLGGATPPDIMRVPSGGSNGQVLVKSGDGMSDLEWATLEGGLNAAGQDNWFAPVATGTGTWLWRRVVSPAELAAVSTAAGKAQTTANTANTNAGKAQTTANTANTNAGKAQAAANAAQAAANAAQAAADAAQAAADAAQGTANGAEAASRLASRHIRDNVSNGRVYFGGLAGVDGTFVKDGVYMGLDGSAEGTQNAVWIIQSRESGNRTAFAATADGGLNMAKMPYAMAAGYLAISSTFPVVTMPGGRFTEAPRVVGQMISGSGADHGKTIMITNVTTTQFQARHTGSSATVPMSWIAVQMSTTKADG